MIGDAVYAVVMCTKQKIYPSVNLNHYESKNKSIININYKRDNDLNNQNNSKISVK